MYSTRTYPLKGRRALSLAQVWASFRHIVDESDMELTALFLGTYQAAFGLWLILPSDSFSGARIYDAMAQLASESVWGTFFLVIGLAKIAGVLCADLYWSFDLWRWTTLAGMGSFVFLAVMFAIGNPAAPGALLYSLLAVVSCNIYRRLGHIG